MDLVPMYRRSAAPIAAAAVRILVAIEPQMYREVLAFHLRQERPRSAEVSLASPQTLLAEAERVRPHLIVANEVPPKLKEMCFWVEVRTDDGLDATISANGYSDTIHDVTLQDLLAVVDKTVEEFAHGA
jgi:DNA-binding IclR family transcriptional regulator